MPLFWLLAACTPDFAPDDKRLPYILLECSVLHTDYTGEELQAEVDYYEGLSDEPAVVSVSFYHTVGEDLNDGWEGSVDAPTDAFSIVSSEVVEDGWTDMYGNPLNTTVFSIYLGGTTTISDRLIEFFDTNGTMSLMEGEDVWFYAMSTGQSLNMYLTSYGYEQDYGHCTLM